MCSVLHVRIVLYMCVCFFSTFKLLKAMENSSDVQTAADKSKESDGATRGQCVCKDCGKVYARKNWLSLHMLGHRKALMALPQKANDEAQKSDGQVFGSSLINWMNCFIFFIHNSNISFFPHLRRRKKVHPLRILKVKKEKTVVKHHFRVPFAIKSFHEQCG